MRNRISKAELIRLDSTVASATPLTVIPNTITKNKLSITLITPDVSRQISGVRVLPRLRKIADAKSYSRITGIPAI